MAKNEIGQRIKLEGEKEYNSALTEAKRNLKTLQSALKAETAELGKNATEQQKTEIRVKSLQKQIKEQEKIVKTYTEALAEVKEKYSDNQGEIARWEIKLNDARTALAKMKNGLEDVGQGFQQAAVDANTGVTAAQSFASAFGGLAGLGEGISGAIEDVFKGMLDVVRGAAMEIWNLIAETAAKADAWGDLAGFYGSTAEEVQSLDRAITGAGADFQQFVAFMNQLEFRGKDDKLTEWLGISDENYENKLEFAMLAMSQLAQKQKELGAGKFNEQLGEVFSGKSAGIVELIGEWDRILAYKKEYNEKGYLMDEDELGLMNEVDNQLHDIETKWDMLKGKFSEGFGNVTLDIMTNVQGSLDALAKFFDAETPEEREEALEDLKEAILATFESIADAIREGIEILGEVAEELKNSKDPLVQGIGNILGGIVDALKWFTEDNAKNVVTALEVIAAFWITGKGLTMGTKIAGIVANLKTIQLFNAMNGGGAGAGAGAGASAGAGAGVTGGGLGLAGWGGLAGLGLIGASAAWAVDRRLNHKEDVLGTEENLDKSAGGNAAFREKFGQWVQAQGMWESMEMSVLNGEADEAELDALQKRINDLYEEIHGQDEFGKTWDSYNAWREEQGMRFNQWELSADWWKGGENEDGVTSQDIQSLNKMPEAVKGAVAALIGSIRISMDGEKVADLVADRVSERVARDLED